MSNKSFGSVIIEASEDIHKTINVYPCYSFIDEKSGDRIYEITFSIPDLVYCMLAVLVYWYNPKDQSYNLQSINGAIILFTDFISGKINPETFLKEEYDITDIEFKHILDKSVIHIDKDIHDPEEEILGKGKFIIK